MEHLTATDISNFLEWAAGIAIAAGVLYGGLKKWLNTMFEKQMVQFNEKIDGVTKKIDKVDRTLSDKIDEVDRTLSKNIADSDMHSCKNFLVRCIDDLERGEELSETVKERFKEQYDHYTSPENKGNSYIKDKVEKLKADGRL